MLLLVRRCHHDGDANTYSRRWLAGKERGQDACTGDVSGTGEAGTFLSTIPWISPDCAYPERRDLLFSFSCG
jgi:hypothetical protein